MLVAVSLAIALHVGFIYLEFAPKPIFVPSVSLPRSVSVFLNQKSQVEAPVQQIEEPQTAEHFIEELPAAEIEPEHSVIKKSSIIENKAEIPVQPPVIQEKKIKRHVTEEIASAEQNTIDSADNFKTGSNKAAKVQKPVTKTEHQEVQQDDKNSLKGTVQTA